MHTILRRQVLLQDAVYKIAQLARDEDPEIARVYIETSDQGEYLTAGSVTYRSDPEGPAADWLDEQVDNDTAVSIEDWASSLSWDDANGDAPGWVITNARGGHYYIDVDEALAVEEPPEIKPVDLVQGVLGLHTLKVLPPSSHTDFPFTCSCGVRAPDLPGFRQHLAEQIVEVLS